MSDSAMTERSNGWTNPCEEFMESWPLDDSQLQRRESTAEFVEPEK